MVYYKHTLKRLKGGRYDGEDGRNTYWMLGFDKRKTAHELREYLDTNAYHAPTNASKAVLMDAVGRHQRGLLSYEKYCTYELLAFCQARKIFVPSRATTPARIARVLEKADDDATFPRFLDLPAELRSRIYELHFSDYRIHTRHRQPPLTLVPRVRAEALPCFYKCATFLWLLTLRSFGFGSDPFGYYYDHSTCGLMEMPADLLAQVRTFNIYWAFVRHTRSGLKCHVNFSVCVSQHHNMKKEFALVMTSRAEKWRSAEGAVRPMLQGQETPLGDITQTLQRVQLCAIENEVNKALRAAWGM